MMDIEPWNTNGKMNSSNGIGHVSPRPVPSRADYEEPQSLKHVLSQFSQSTSMHGLANINSARRWYVKLFWTLVTLAAMAGLTWSLYDLVATYISYDKQTDIQLSYENIKFPAITICNSNPMRDSTKNLASAELQSFLDNINPDTVVTNLASLNQSASQTEFFEALDYNFTNVRDMYGNTTSSSERFSGAQSNLQMIRNDFNYHFSAQNRSTRISLGHQLSDLLVACSFAGFVCNASDFNLFPTTTYGNCFTLEKKDYISYANGPNKGLELILFLEADEYISTISPGTGAQIEIHDTETWPQPSTRGIAISAGMDTNVAMNMLKITRLGDPYGSCDVGDEFMAAYNRKYTRAACYLVCLEQQIITQCGCYDEENYELNNDIDTRVSGGSVKACETSTEVQCMVNTEMAWQTGTLTCSCANPCAETTYLRDIHSRMWPSQDYAKLLTQYLCNTKNNTECERYKNMSLRELGMNFLKVNIYFNDLNYEEIVESPKYEFIQFLSDIGGAAGLWIGLSILSFSEIFQLIVDVGKLLVGVRNQRRKSKQIHVNRS